MLCVILPRPVTNPAFFLNFPTLFGMRLRELSTQDAASSHRYCWTCHISCKCANHHVVWNRCLAHESPSDNDSLSYNMGNPIQSVLNLSLSSSILVEGRVEVLLIRSCFLVFDSLPSI